MLSHCHLSFADGTFRRASAATASSPADSSPGAASTGGRWRGSAYFLWLISWVARQGRDGFLKHCKAIICWSLLYLLHHCCSFVLCPQWVRGEWSPWCWVISHCLSAFSHSTCLKCCQDQESVTSYMLLLSCGEIVAHSPTQLAFY